MIYIEKKDSEKIQESLDTVIQQALERWTGIPDTDLTKEQVTIVRKEFFDHPNINKDAIRASLFSEQHGLCAYCMSKLYKEDESGQVTRVEHLPIEHYKPLSQHKKYAMDYQNFLGVCNGGEDLTHSFPKRQRILCCDKKKADDDIQIDPLNEEMMQYIAYTSVGDIYFMENDKWDHTRMNQDLNDILYLNGERSKVDKSLLFDTMSGLVKNRHDVYNTTNSYIKANREKISWTASGIARQIEELENAPIREPYVGVKLFLLKREYKRMLRKKGAFLQK